MPEEDILDEEAQDAPEQAEQVVPTHDPFPLKVFSILKAQQSQNGLRHNDHLRYRQYCSRRLRRLYNTLKFKHGRGRYKSAPFPPDFEDARFLEVPLVNAERAWSYGVQLKSDNATAAQINLQWRQHSIRRLAKALKWAQFLESVCKIHGDQRTQLEAEAYTALMSGTLLLEKEEFKEALAEFMRCRKVLDHLSLASEQEEAKIFKEKLQELAPMIRECKYNLNIGMGEDDDVDEKKADQRDAQRKDLSGLAYRGQGISVPSDKINTKLLKVLQLVSAVKEGGHESNAVNEEYGKLSAEFGDVLRDIHAEMIAAGVGEQASDWRMLEAYVREISTSMNVERNLVLLWNHLAKLDGLDEVSSSEARRTCRPEEGMRYCDLLKEDIQGLQELPETNDDISELLSAYIQVVANCRCLFLALCYTSQGKRLEAASLLDMLHARVEDVQLGGPQPEPLGRLHPLVGRIQEKMPTCVGCWRCRGLAALCAANLASAKGRSEEVAPGQSLQDFASLSAFPPKVRDIPCKPLLFDLAFPCLKEPDLEVLLPKSQEKKGLLRGLTSGIGGLFRGKK